MKQIKKHQQNMLGGPILPSILAYTIPIILTSLLQLLFNAADLVVVGQFCGSISVAAVGATGALTGLVVNLFIGLSTGAGVTVAHAIGSKEEDVVHRTVHTALPTALISGAILTVVGISFSEAALKLMGTPDNILPLSALYMKIYFGGMTFNMVYNFCASILRAAGDTKSPLLFLSISGIVNVILNFIFVSVFHMNVEGVALATTISQALSAVLVVITLMRRADACRLILPKIRIYAPQLLKIIRIGLPAGIQSSLFSISNVMIQSSINSFGDVFMTGNAAAGNIEGFEYVALNAFGQTALNFCGQNIGARQYKRALKITLTCAACVTGLGALLSGLIYGFGPGLLSVYITDSPQAISYGMIRFVYVSAFCLLCGVMDVFTGSLRGMGASVAPMVISTLGICGLRIAWVNTAFQIPEFHTPQWLYASYPISWIVTLAMEATVFVYVYRQHIRKDSCQPSPLT